MRLLRLDEQKLGAFKRLDIDSQYEQMKGELGVVAEGGQQQLDHCTNQEASAKAVSGGSGESSAETRGGGGGMHQIFTCAVTHGNNTA